MISIDTRLDENGIIELITSLEKGEFLPIEQVLDQATTVLLNRTRTRFLDERDPDGKKWIPSKAGRLRREAGGSGTLYDTGSLFHSISLITKKPRSHILGVLPGATNTETGMPVADYAIVHQTGRWPFLGVSDADADAVVDVLKYLLVRNLGNAAK